MEKASFQNEGAEDSTRQDDEDSKTSKKKLFEEGSRTWLYMERVKPELTKKLAHRWHGPQKVVELPDKSG
ncbi:hypothetical protein PHMEG_00030226 [Phytophthora megakarya]|uniref:Reverse transcriptase n=1 Tax=Phytophthora megakarya TaxID=4795 RepID=A0A225UZA9_9STRA|nr:hypothetical protein PHMEG_00030226 [Phytophthora megakarya]